MIEAIASKAHETPEAGAVLQADDVWARGQVATAIVLEPRTGPIEKACGEGLMAGALPLLARLGRSAD